MVVLEFVCVCPECCGFVNMFSGLWWFVSLWLCALSDVVCEYVFRVIVVCKFVDIFAE